MSKDVRIRTCAGSDVDEIVRIHRASLSLLFGTNLNSLKEPDVFKREWLKRLADPNLNIWVAQYDSTRIFGFVQRRTESGVMEIVSMYVDPNARGRGVGSRLINEALNYAAQGSSKAIVWVWEENFLALQFYKNHGFVTSSQSRTRTILWSNRNIREIMLHKACSAE